MKMDKSLGLLLLLVLAHPTFAELLLVGISDSQLQHECCVLLHVNVMVAVTREADLGANVLVVALGETASVAAEFEFCVLVIVVLIFTQTNTTEE